MISRDDISRVQKQGQTLKFARMSNTNNDGKIVPITHRSSP